MNNTQKRFDLTGKNIFLSGATGHLGREIVRAIVEMGGRIILHGRSRSKLKEIVKDLELTTDQYICCTFDLTSISEIEIFFKKLEWNELHGVVNNAYSGRGGTVQTSEVDDFINAYRVSVVAAQVIFKCAFPFLRRAVENGQVVSVVNISTMYSKVSPDLRIYDSPEGSNPPFYGAAKAALSQWGKYVACEFGKEGIRVNNVLPGPFPSRSVQEHDPFFVKRLAEKVPLGRIGQAEELGGVVAFLMSDASSYMNGSSVVVDGGWTSF